MITRRDFVAQAAGLALGGLGGRRLWAGSGTGPGTAITIYKSATCGCCAKWVDHLRANDWIGVIAQPSPEWESTPGVIVKTNAKGTRRGFCGPGVIYDLAAAVTA